MTDEDKWKKLEALGAAQLAKALIDLSQHDADVENLVESLISTTDENAKRFKAKLSGLKRARRFIPWGESSRFAKDLRLLLLDLQEGVKDPHKGASLVIEFYETDRANFERCDDSSGHVGDVYRYDAVEVFVNYAKHCDDKAWLANLLIELNKDDDYGVRDSLIDHVAEFLPEETIRDLTARMQKFASNESEQYRRRHWLHCIESLAMQIRDAELFENARLSSDDKPSTAACVDIAKAYLAAGKAEIALDWLLRISSEESFMNSEREGLLLEVYTQLGNQDGQQEIAWRIFKRSRSAASFEKLLRVVGEEQREGILESEISEIMESERFSYSDVEFLIQADRMNDAASYILGRFGQIDGALYFSLLPMAEGMETSAKWLAATVIYRALLDSILSRAKTKTYPHGVKYLNKLGRISRLISDWKSIETHVEYLERLRKEHGKKTSFWRGFD